MAQRVAGRQYDDRTPGRPSGRDPFRKLAERAVQTIADALGNYTTTTVRELLPDSFGPRKLAEGVTGAPNAEAIAQLDS